MASRVVFRSPDCIKRQVRSHAIRNHNVADTPLQNSVNPLKATGQDKVLPRVHCAPMASRALLHRRRNGYVYIHMHVLN